LLVQSGELRDHGIGAKRGVDTVSAGLPQAACQLAVADDVADRSGQ
jgi:hypothetical protein